VIADRHTAEPAWPSARHGDQANGRLARRLVGPTRPRLQTKR
jgi:hypothetical protein